MSLANPWGLLAGLLTVPLVAWYVLRSRRPRVTVASTFLWEDVDRSVAAAIPWQRFRPDLTFWLALLAIIAGAVALAQPFLPVATTLGDHTVLVVDTSGSMLADEAGPSRLELARREAVALIDRAGPGQRLSVVQAGSRARVLLTRSDDRGAARDALASLDPDHGQADLADAFTLAAALRQPGESFVGLLFTDHEVPTSALALAPPGLSVVAVGSALPNLAVTRLQAVPGPEGSQVFVQVRNLGQGQVDAELDLAVAGTSVIQERFRLAPRGTADRVLQVTGEVGDVLSATVTPVGAADAEDAAVLDRLSIDDQAVTLLSDSRALDVVVATPGNVFLEAALEAVPGVTVEVVEEVPADLADVDLLVADRVRVASTLTVPTLLVAPTSLPDGLTRGAVVEAPTLTFQTAGDALLTDVDLSDTGIAEATPLAGPTVGAVAGGPAGDLIVAGTLEGVPVVAIGFDLLQSNLPLLPAWPVLVNNIAASLTGPSATLPVVAGATVVVPVPPGATGLRVEPPAAPAFEVPLTSPRVTVDEVGLWRLAWEGNATGDAVPAIAVNPDQVESDLVSDLASNGLVVAPDDTDATDGGDGDPSAADRTGRRTLVPWLLLGVLVLVVAEWLWAQVIRPRRAARAPGPGGRGRRRGRPPTDGDGGPAGSSGTGMLHESPEPRRRSPESNPGDVEQQPPHADNSTRTRRRSPESNHEEVGV